MRQKIIIIGNIKRLSRNSQGVTHLLLPVLAVLLVAGIGSYLVFQGHADPIVNPYLSKCPGNAVLYGQPSGAEATTAARERVFGKPYPHANVEKTTFMGKSVYVNKKIVGCLNAVQWDINHIGAGNYAVHQLYGASTVSAQNPTNYFHAYGGAIDINPSQNPQCLNSCKHDMPASWVKAFAWHGFFWGGYFSTHKDYMHFEWHGQK